MRPKLREIPLASCLAAMPRSVTAFVDEGLRRSKAIDCFDFVPSNSRVLYATLSALPRERFCEWGSGMGIGVGIAEMLGFDACGIEVDASLAAASRRLLADFGLTAKVETGSYFNLHCEADVYFVYSWPSQIRQVEDHFSSVASDSARLLICHGAADIRCKTPCCHGTRQSGVAS